MTDSLPVRPETAAQDRPPNFRDEHGKIYLVRCYVCDPIRGRENYAPAVSAGVCAWCNWGAADA